MVMRMRGLCAVVLAAVARGHADLPGLDAPVAQCWESKSGYLDVSDGIEIKSLFYWYHAAIEDASDTPVVLWLNGGPGCSSLGGMWTEHGPYVLDERLRITLNPYSWNRVANVLYLEQPAGVGFSYPNATIDDATTAKDTYDGLLAFFDAQPKLAGRPFYVAGESYGGHYVPNIVEAIEVGNAQLPFASRINLKGFMVGNGYTDWQLDFNANVENGRFHALTSEADFRAAEEACGGDYARCFWPRPGVECPDACGAAVDKATRYAMDGSIDIYDIYEDVCLGNASAVATQASTLEAFRGARKARRLGGTEISPLFGTCIDTYVERYLNDPKVQAAVGVRPGTVPGGRWADCGVMTTQYQFNFESELPKYRKWTEKGDLQILIYNGDADYILSHVGNAAWISSLNLTKSKDWSAWRGSDKQVAGYFEQYATGGIPLTFLTVKGAGHMVPKDRPRHALDVFARFLAGGDYDKVAPAPETPLCG